MKRLQKKINDKNQKLKDINKLYHNIHIMSDTEWSGAKTYLN